MSQPIEYHLSIMPEPYESAPTPEDITIEEIKARATAEENYVEAMAKHSAWKEAKAVVEREEKSRLAHEVRAAKVEALKQKAEEKRKAKEKRQEEERLYMLKEKQEAEERQRVVELKAKVDEATWLKEKERKDKETADAISKKKQKKKEKKEKKWRKAKVVMESSSDKEARDATEAVLAKDERGTDGDTKGGKSGTSKE